MDAHRILSARFVAGLAVLSAAGAALQYLQLATGATSLFYDAEEIWRPLAREVFGGAALYADVWDNKPPLFEFLNLAIAAIDVYVPVFIVALALANLTSSALIVVLCEHEGYPRVGRLAAVFFLAMVIPLQGYQINPRPFANIGVLVALIAVRPGLAGAGVAAAGLFTQFSVLAIPVIVWRRWRSHGPFRADIGWYLRFGAAGLGTVAVAYLAVAAVWGVPAMVAGLENTFFPLSEYMTRKADESLWVNPLRWTRAMASDLSTVAAPVALAVYGGLVALAPLVRVAGVGVAAQVRTDGTGARGDTHDHTFVRQMLALSLLLSFQSMIRVGSGVYFVSYAPFVGIVAAFGALVVTQRVIPLNQSSP